MILVYGLQVVTSQIWADNWCVCIDPVMMTWYLEQELPRNCRVGVFECSFCVINCILSLIHDRVLITMSFNVLIATLWEKLPNSVWSWGEICFWGEYLGWLTPWSNFYVSISVSWYDGLTYSGLQSVIFLTSRLVFLSFFNVISWLLLLPFFYEIS